MIVGSICLSDIPKELITNHTNGKKYLAIAVDEKKQADNYGNTHSIQVNLSKEDREAGKPKVYIGSGKEIIFGGAKKETKAPDYEQLPDDQFDDLPF